MSQAHSLSDTAAQSPIVAHSLGGQVRTAYNAMLRKLSRYSTYSYNAAWLLSLDTTSTTEHAAGVWEVILDLSENRIHTPTPEACQAAARFHGAVLARDTLNSIRDDLLEFEAVCVRVDREKAIKHLHSIIEEKNQNRMLAFIA